MAVLFSEVTVTANDDKTVFLASGIPTEYEDLEGWTAFDRFMSQISDNTEIKVHTESYLYGGGNHVNATPEEIAYFMQRIADDENFLSGHCENIGNSDFNFSWLGEELFRTEMEL